MKDLCGIRSLHFLLKIAAVATVCVASIACSTPAQSAKDQRLQDPTPGKGVKISFSDKPVALPDFTLTDLDGKPIDRASWSGKVVLLNFWATWCGPCRAEIPDLVALQDRYRDSLVVVGLSVDEVPAAAVKKFAQAQHVNYPVAIVSEKIQDQFGGLGTVPSTFVLNKAGRIVQRHVGMLNAERTEQEVRSLTGLPTAADVELFSDTGQMLLAHAAYVTDVPGVDLSDLTPAQKEAALKQLNTDTCTCGCAFTVAQCRIKDPGCSKSPPIAASIVKRIKDRSPTRGA